MNSLCGVVRDQMGHEVCMGDVFIFYVGNKIMLILRYIHLI
ncbi:MAG: hypothetical protein VB054_05930 [Petrimonas sp.]|nr:hypothetical protein [Petrimonas sp.]